MAPVAGMGHGVTRSGRGERQPFDGLARDLRDHVDARLWTDDNRLAAVSDEPNNYVLEAAVEAGPLSDRL